MAKEHVWGPRINNAPGVRCEDCFQAAEAPHQNTPCEGEPGTGDEMRQQVAKWKSDSGPASAEKQLLKVAEALKCEPQQVQVVATAVECSLRLATHDFEALRELSETCCKDCDFFEDDGDLRSHCSVCCRRIVTELYHRMHLPAYPDPEVTKEVCLVARCRQCGSVGAACVIDMEQGTCIDLGRIVQKTVRGFLVRVEPAPVAIGGCQCEAKR